MIKLWDGELNFLVTNMILYTVQEKIKELTHSQFSRIQCSAISSNALKELHNSLSDPGTTRMSHFVWTRNLPFSMDDIKRATSEFQVCSELKPQFHKVQGQLIHAT